MSNPELPEAKTRLVAWDEPRGTPEALLAPRPWGWSWSPWVGVMYGPVPVGLIVGVPLLIALWR